jgi:hypothetical protein
VLMHDAYGLPRARRRGFAIALFLGACIVSQMLTVNGASAQTAILPTEADRAAYEEGRALGRAVLFMKEPHACTISLLRVRCRHDGAVLLTHLPSATVRLATIKAAFESADFRRFDLGSIDDIQPEFTQKPGIDRHGSWLLNAGMTEVLATGVEHDQGARGLILTGISTLVEQASDAPTFANAVLAEPLRVLKADSGGAVSDTQLAAWVDTMSARLRRIFPEPTFPHVNYAPGPRGDAQFGVAIATLIQIAETPAFLVQPESQEFLDETFARFDGYLSPDQRDVSQQMRRQLRPAGIPLQPYGADGPMGRLTALIGGGIERMTGRRVFVGSLSAQIAHNALSHRDPASAKSFPALLGALDGVDSAVPGLKGARAALASADSTDWDDVNRKATAIVDLLMGS